MEGKKVKQHFEDKDVRSLDALPGTLDNIPFYLMCLKEPDYVISLMSTYGTTNRMELKTKKKIHF